MYNSTKSNQKPEYTCEKFFRSSLARQISEKRLKALTLLNIFMLKRGPFALSLHWPDLAGVVLVVSVKSEPISVRSVV